MRLLLPCDHPGKPKRPKVGTRSSSAQGKRTPLKNRFSPLENLQETKSSDEEEVVEVEVDRLLKGKQMSMSKWDFLQRMTEEGFSYYFCMMIEGSGSRAGSGSGSRAGSGSGSIPLTSGSGSGRPKNTWIRWIRIRWIRIRNTDFFAFVGDGGKNVS
jgi:hypothetical protein